MKNIFRNIKNNLFYLIPLYVALALFSPIWAPMIFNSNSNESISKQSKKQLFKPDYEFTLNFLSKPFEEFLDSTSSNPPEEFIIDSLRNEINNLLDNLGIFNDTLHLYYLGVVANDSLHKHLLEIYSEMYSPYEYASQDYIGDYMRNFSLLEISKTYFFTVTEEERNNFKKTFPDARKVRMFEAERTIVVRDTVYFFEGSNKRIDSLQEIFITKPTSKQ